MDSLYSGISDLHDSDIPEPRDLEAELFNKKSIREMVTNFERELGLNPGKKGKNTKRHALILSPAKEDDSEKLAVILNDDAKYRIMMWKDTWTVHGDYRIFLIYEEIIDEKKRKTPDEKAS